MAKEINNVFRVDSLNVDLDKTEKTHNATQERCALMPVSDRPINERIRAARDRQGVPAKEAGKALGISKSEYLDVENGARPFKGGELILLADTFGITVSAIVGEKRQVAWLQ